MLSKPGVSLVTRSVSAFMIGFLATLATTAKAVPDSSLSPSPLIQTGTDTHDWPAPAAGELNGYSGDIWVTGVGSLSNGGSTVYNGWVSTYAERSFTGTMTDIEVGRWNLDVHYPGKCKANAHYVGTGLVPVMERFRAETTGVAEIRGDVTLIDATQVVVDSYSEAGSYSFDAIGGGDNPTNYGDVGFGIVSSAVDGQNVVNPWEYGNFIMPQGGVTHVGTSIQFTLYCRGKQYMHCDKEEDVSLGTNIEAGEADDGEVRGWTGQLKSERFDGNRWVLVRIHPIG